MTEQKTNKKMKKLFLLFALSLSTVSFSQNLYEIKVINCMTDGNGRFTITDSDYGFNVLQWAQYADNEPFRAITEYEPDPSTDATNANTAFEQLVGYYSRSLDEVYNCEDCRIYGTKTFVAKNGGGVPIQNDFIKVVVVYWNE